jgi:diguanylate cyclase (GGDEF)-like protein/PAS domain S-box-containing protein
METQVDPFRELIDNFHDGVYFVDHERVITYWNGGAQALTGFSADEVLGRHCRDDILCHVDDSGDPLCGERCPLADCMRDGKTRTEQLFFRHRQGHRHPVVVRTAPIRDRRNVIVGGVQVFSDNADMLEAKQQLEALQRLAMFDPLTGIGNRRYFEVNLHARLDERRRYGNPFGLLLVDLDRFKAINDTHGHDIGDRVLKMVADTLAYSCRKSDLACRWGGEEFALLLGNVDRGEFHDAAQRVRKLLKRSKLPLDGSDSLRVTASWGAAFAADQDDEASLLKRADTLLYHAKHTGRDRICHDDG